MLWTEAKTRIASLITTGTRLARSAKSARQVLAVNHGCTRHGYGGESGFLVRIGLTSAETIDIPWSMLEACFSDLTAGGYDGEAFRRRYPKQAFVHPCHVHTVGQLLVLGGVATSDGRKQARYTIVGGVGNEPQRPLGSIP